MKNHAMQHAIVSAHKKAEEHKKGDTLSLPHNKRASDADAQKPAEQAMPQVAEKALQQAVQALHDGVTSHLQSVPAEQKTASSAAVGNMNLGDFPLIVPRVDLLKNQVIFLAHTQNPQTGEIQYINLKEGEVKTAPVEYYRSTQPVEKEALLKDMVKQFVGLSGNENFRLRKRLIKNHVLERDEDGKVDAKGLDNLQAKLLNAVKQFEQAIAEAFKTAA